MLKLPGWSKVALDLRRSKRSNLTRNMPILIATELE